jgi:hypothetical protein
VIKSGRTGWAVCVADTGGSEEEYTRIWLGNLRKRHNLDIGIDGRIRLK